MYQGHLGKRYYDHDPNQLGYTRRDRTAEEVIPMGRLIALERAMRDFLTDLPSDVDGRCKSTAITKLDELVLWAKKGIDA